MAGDLGSTSYGRRAARSIASSLSLDRRVHQTTGRHHVVGDRVHAGTLGAGPAVSSGTAALVIGFCGEALTERLRIPPLLVTVCGIIPLLPGLRIYYGLFSIVVDADIEQGLAALTGAFAIGLALASGVTLGQYLGRPLRGDRDRYDERVRRRAMTTD